MGSFPSYPYMNVVGLKWVFKTKLKADGSVECRQD